MNKEELKENLKAELIKSFIEDWEKGDTTVIDEVLNNVHIDVLIESLPEERWEDYKELRNTTSKEQLIREYNEDMHPGYGLNDEDLYTLDESELEDFENWKKRNKK